MSYRFNPFTNNLDDTGGTAVVNLDGLTDVTITNPINGQVFQYDAASGVWINSILDTSVPDGNKGDIIVTSSGTTWTIDDSVITYAKIQDVSATGRLLGRYSAGTGTIEEISLGNNLSLNNDTLNVLNETLYVNVKNTSGSPLSKGTPVYVTGSVGGTNVLEVASADSANTAKCPAIGLLVTELAHNSTGRAIMFGELTGINTSGYAVNDELFVASGGGLTKTKPSSGYIQSLAVVSRSHTSTGSILVWVAGRINEARGSNTHVQFNDAGNLAGVSDLTYNKTTKVLTNKV